MDYFLTATLSALAGFIAGVYFVKPVRAELYAIREKIEGLYAHATRDVKKAL